MAAPFLPLVFFLDEFFGDMFFVVLVLTGSYILYVLYLNFHDQPMIFAIAAIAGATFLLTNSLLTVVLVSMFFVFVMAGMNFQQILMFSVYPVLGMLGFKVGQYGPVSGEEAKMMEQQQIEQKILRGEQVSAAEKGTYAEYLNNQSAGQQQQMQEQMMRRR